MLDILSDPVARVPGFGLDTPFDFPSHHFTDNWAVAWPAEYAEWVEQSGLGDTAAAARRSASR